MAQEGRINLVELVSEEFDRPMEQAGPAVARRVFDLAGDNLSRLIHDILVVFEHGLRRIADGAG
jgi:hypothetical protein